MFAPGDEVHVAGLGKGVVREVRNGGRYLVELKGRSVVTAEAQLSAVSPRKRPALSDAQASKASGLLGGVALCLVPHRNHLVVHLRDFRVDRFDLDAELRFHFDQLHIEAAFDLRDPPVRFHKSLIHCVETFCHRAPERIDLRRNRL